jgi:hypothetical protein
MESAVVCNRSLIQDAVNMINKGVKIISEIYCSKQMFFFGFVLCFAAYGCSSYECRKGVWMLDLLPILNMVWCEFFIFLVVFVFF